VNCSTLRSKDLTCPERVRELSTEKEMLAFV